MLLLLVCDGRKGLESKGTKLSWKAKKSAKVEEGSPWRAQQLWRHRHPHWLHQLTAGRGVGWCAALLLGEDQLVCGVPCAKRYVLASGMPLFEHEFLCSTSVPAPLTPFVYANMSSRADYLSKYLNADPGTEKKSKKRKRKGTSTPADGLIIADDDLTGWDSKNAQDDEDGPTMVTGQSAAFRKAKKSAWISVGSAAPKDSDQAAADKIIEQAAQENRDRAEDAEDAPVIEGEVAEVEVLASGMRPGLQSSKDIGAALKKKKADERRKAKEAGEDDAAPAETIYRDASGRIINVAMKRAEARKKAEEEELKKRQEEEASKGDAQRLMKEARRKELEDAKYMNLARKVDDVEMNDELKERDRWNDPAAQFVTKKKKGRSITGKPLYQGSSMPNRYGIRPGHRWDGVDRGNGFEKLWFNARNKVKNKQELEYMWQMDE
jgi:pre-mRNA-splicing factor CWC26